jgi:VanZ family protein
LIGLTAIIVYGSLYPFDFYPVHYPHGPIRSILATWPNRPSLGDLIANILLYLPLGFCAVQSFRASRRLRSTVAIALGTGLSVSLEFVQLYDRGRWASVSDIALNSLGTVLGTIAGLAVEPLWSVMPRFSARVRPFPAILLACWAGYRLFPYAPVIDLHKYWHAVRPLLNPQFSPVELCQYTVCSLAIAFLLHEVFDGALAMPALAFAIGTVLFGRILIDQTALSISEVAGAALAVLLWIVWLSHARASTRWVCSLFVVNVLVQGLNPFRFSAQGHGYVWIPFYGLLEGEPQVAIPSVFEKSFAYGTLLWLLGRAGFSGRAAAAIGGALVLSISLVHVYMPQRTAEVTDFVLLLLMGAVLQLTDRPSDCGGSR